MIAVNLTTKRGRDRVSSSVLICIVLYPFRAFTTVVEQSVLKKWSIVRCTQCNRLSLNR